MIGTLMTLQFILQGRGALQKSDAQMAEDSQGHPHRQHHTGHCPAEKRHKKEQAEVEEVIGPENMSSTSKDKPNSYTVKANAPVRISTKIKGIKPGFQITPGRFDPLICYIVNLLLYIGQQVT